MIFRKVLCWAGFSALVSLCVVSIARAQIARQIAQNTFPSVVLLMMEDAKGQTVSLGSGFFVRSGIIATNLHVIEGAASGYAKIVGEKTKYDIAGIVGISREWDLVILSLTGSKAPSLSLCESCQVAAGDEVYVVGNPLGARRNLFSGHHQQRSPGWIRYFTTDHRPHLTGK